MASAYNGSGHGPLPAQTEVLGAVNDGRCEPRDVVVCAAGSLPGDLHSCGVPGIRKGYHVEYGFSCMGYEIAGGIGVTMAAPDRDVFVTRRRRLVPDDAARSSSPPCRRASRSSWSSCRTTAIASIGALSESRRRAAVRHRVPVPAARAGRLDGDVLPVDLAANAASLGATCLRAPTRRRAAGRAGRTPEAADRTTVVHIETDPLGRRPDGERWWDVPVAEVSTLDSTQQARAAYDKHKRRSSPTVTRRSTTAASRRMQYDRTLKTYDPATQQ